jgi:hypothetical protein
MTNRRGVVVRILADLFVACLVPLCVFASSRTGSANPAFVIGALGAQLIAVAVMAWLEPSAKMVWIHALVIMLPELIALPVAILTCRGHGCVGGIVMLILANLITLLLVALSYAIFYIRRRMARSRRK